jgi:hypothetical protein
MAMSETQIHVGYGVQLGGLIAMGVGAVMSLHHLAIGVCLMGGAAAVYLGRKLREVTL